MTHHILITGGNGQIATAITKHARAENYLLTACSSNELDITHTTSIEKAISHFEPDIIINTAAFTAVDRAEVDTELAEKVNCHGIKQLAILCNKNRIPLIHLSTDYIFDGESLKPYQENDQKNPINFYGKSKWLGEQAVREYCQNHIILRVSGVFSEFGHNFLRTMLRLAKEKTSLGVVDDQTTCPTYAGDIANTIFTLIEQGVTGTYHYCSSKPTTWYDFARIIFQHAKEKHLLALQTLQPISAVDYRTTAKRPRYSVLDCAKLQKDTGIAPPNWEDGIISALAGMHS